MTRLGNNFFLLILIVFTHDASAFDVIDQPFEPKREIAEIANELSEFIPEAMEKAQVPGLSMAIIRDGKLIYQEDFGNDNSWDNSALKPQQIFEVASLSKPVLAYGVLKLVDKGLVDLDRPINQYLESAPELVTIRQALTHTSALQQIGRSGYASNIDSEKSNPKANKPGENFAYSPAGYLLVGDLIEKISGQILENYLSNEVLKPLKMLDSGYGDFPTDKTQMAQPHTSTTFPLLVVLIFGLSISVVALLLIGSLCLLGNKYNLLTIKTSTAWVKLTIAISFSIAIVLLFYFFNSFNATHYALIVVPVYSVLFLSLALLMNTKKYKTQKLIVGSILLLSTLLFVWQRHAVPIDFRGASPAAYGGLRATSVDMAYFLDELMFPTKIKSQTMTQMLEPQVEVNSHTAWGLGIGIQTHSKQKVIWHWGINYPGYQALMLGYPEQRLGIVILMNGGPMVYGSEGLSTRGLELAREIVAKSFGGEHYNYWLGVQ